MELSMKINRAELFDPYVLTPHNELNSAVYSTVDRFLRKSVPEILELHIYSQPMHEALQERVREVFHEHYIDEKKAMNMKMNYVNLRFIILLAASVSLLYFQFVLNKENINNIIIIVMGQFGAYFLWQLGDTWFDWLEKSRALKQINTALKAEITFYELNNRQE